jgi:alkanesulfonate monooxygenase SsuD/methylene tetrahydromethanopterin reductase-like flavin-dependent oxidoreductase (luciferase family)
VAKTHVGDAGPRRVKLSAFTVVDEFPAPVAGSRDRYAEVFQLADAAESSGLHALWIAEHHFQPGGLCPCPPILLAAAATRTHRLRLGALVSVLPFHNPIEVAEQYAMVDRLSGGRLNLGVGSGYIPLEFQGFGVDPQTKRERFDRALETLLGAFRGEPLTVPGPHGGTVRVNVVPVQRPSPPITIAVQRREALPFVARRGASVAMVPYATVQDLPELAEQIREYRRHLPTGSTASVSVALHIYAGDRPELAREALQGYLDGRLATQSTFYQEKVRQDPRQADARAIERSGFALFGSPSDVAERLKPFGEAGVDEVLGIFDFGGLAAGEVADSVRRLGARLTA